jgi:hypothetical protein
LPSLRLLVGINAGTPLALQESFCIFWAIETRLLRRWWVDFITKRMQSDGDFASQILCELSCLWGFVDGDRSL